MKRFRLFVVLLAIFLVAYAGVTVWPTGNQLLARGDLEALLGAGKLVLVAGDPGWGTTNAQLASYTDFTTYFKNNAACGGSASQIISSTAAQACAVLTSVHTPILANNSFASNSFTSWSATTATYTGTCTSAVNPTAGSTASQAQDADGGSAQLTDTGTVTNRTNCSDNGTGTFTIGITQSVSIPAASTSQSYSFYYLYNRTTVGSATNGCVTDSGTVSNIILSINGTTVSTTATPVSGSWQHVTGSTTALINGSNTFTLKATIQDALAFNWNSGSAACDTAVAGAQPLYLDTTALTGTW